MGSPPLPPPEANFVYSGLPVEPVNVQAARAMSGGRRLLDDVMEL